MREDERHDDLQEDSDDLHDDWYDLHDELHEGASVMKKILLLIAAVVGALAIQKKFKDQQAEQDLWAEATDKV